MLDLSNSSFCIFGLPDSGKSTLANYVIQQFNQVLVFDPLNEYLDEPYDRYVPTNRGSAQELEQITRLVLKTRQYQLFLIDEANRYCPSKPHPLPQAIADLNDWRAHYLLTCGFIARRPVQLHQDLTELANYLFIFKLPGKNDLAYLNDLSSGLGDAVQNCPKYHFYLVQPDRSFELMEPVPESYKTNKPKKRLTK